MENLTNIEKQEIALKNLRDAVAAYQAAGVVLNTPGWADSIAKGCKQISQSAGRVYVLQD